MNAPLVAAAGLKTRVEWKGPLLLSNVAHCGDGDLDDVGGHDLDLLTQAGGVGDKLRSLAKAPPLTESDLTEDGSLSLREKEGSSFPCQQPSERERKRKEVSCLRFASEQGCQICLVTRSDKAISDKAFADSDRPP